MRLIYNFFQILAYFVNILRFEEPYSQCEDGFQLITTTPFDKKSINYSMIILKRKPEYVYGILQGKLMNENFKRSFKFSSVLTINYLKRICKELNYDDIHVNGENCEYSNCDYQRIQIVKVKQFLLI